MSAGNSPTGFQKFIQRVLYSKSFNRVSNIPPFSWLLSLLGRAVAAQATRKPPAVTHTTAKVGADSLDDILHRIVDDVVNALGYTGAMVATLEQGDQLPVRAFYVDPKIATREQVIQWEQALARLTGKPISITDPDIARVYISDELYARNLSVQAAHSGREVVDDSLYSLFTPIVPPSARPIVDGIQRQLRVQQVIAMPFFLDVASDEGYRRELVGNLFAARDKPITQQDILVLGAFARQAAAAIESERRRQQAQMAEHIVSLLHRNIEDEQAILQEIVRGVVTELKFVGAIVATYEEMDHSLPVRAFYVDPNTATPKQIMRWEARLSQLTGRSLSLSDPEKARVLLDDPHHRENLSVKALAQRRPLPSDDLYDLFVPFIPPAGRQMVQGVQRALGIRQVIAVPFYLETEVQGRIHREPLGNLFAATRSAYFSTREIEMLHAFGEQAAIGIKNARLYRKSEERHRAAQRLGMEAFTSAGYVHHLRNAITPMRGYLQILTSHQPTTPEEYKRFHELFSHYMVSQVSRLDGMNEIINNLAQPWRHQPHTEVDLLTILRQSREKGIDRVRRENQYTLPIHLDTSEVEPNLPPINTSPDMLRQALVTILQNSTEAIIQRGGEGGCIWVSASCDEERLTILIEDNGTGIKAANMRHIFDMQYTTKTTKHRGFSLFWTKDYIEGMDGKIRIASRWGYGTVVRITLPAARQQNAYT